MRACAGYVCSPLQTAAKLKLTTITHQTRTHLYFQPTKPATISVATNPPRNKPRGGQKTLVYFKMRTGRVCI